MDVWAMELWHVTVAAEALVALCYAAISLSILSSLFRTGELGRNRLGTATGLIFLSCAVGHGLHSAHPLLPRAGHGHAFTVGGEPHEVGWAVLTAAIALYYWTLRGSYGHLLGGTTLFLDHAADRREAVEVNDSIVQSLVAAKLARRLGREEDVDAAIDAALGSARELVERLLDEAAEGRRLVAGDFVRRSPDDAAEGGAR